VLTYVVEEFDEPQARALFYTFLARNRLLGDEDAIDDSVWRVVYEVRGCQDAEMMRACGGWCTR
jgi:hypothetical protein